LLATGFFGLLSLVFKAAASRRLPCITFGINAVVARQPLEIAYQ
jgi:hypothetical protein